MLLTLNFQDIFKKDFLDLEAMSAVSIVNIITGLTITLVLSLFIYIVYKLTFKGVVYNHGFNTTLVLLALITALIIMTISSNIVLSLGMVGAMSIVRFRAAIKDPRDIVFMFWSISVGIASGAGIYHVAVGGTIFISIVILIMSRKSIVIETFLLIMTYDKKAQEEVLVVLNRLKYDMKSKTVVNGKTEMTIEMKKVKNTAFVDELSEIDGVASAALIKYNGDYAE